MTMHRKTIGRAAGPGWPVYQVVMLQPERVRRA